MISLSFTTKDLVLVSTKDLLSDPTSTFYRIVQDSKDRMTRIEQADIHTPLDKNVFRYESWRGHLPLYSTFSPYRPVVKEQ